MSKKSTIGIIGGGVVGGAVKNFFRDAKVYDKYKTLDSIDEVATARFIFICVPTPYNKGLDLSMTDDAIANVAKHLTDPENQLVTIKSTVWPGTTESYQQEYPKLNFAFNPEFLRDRAANEDFIKNDKQIVGYTSKTKNNPMIEELMNLLPRAPYQKIMPAQAAEIIKYVTNTFLAMRVIFANQMYDISQALEVNYDDVRDILKSDKRIGKSHWDVLFENYRGYGGKCFPKEMYTSIDKGNELGVDMSLFERARDINLKLNSGEHDG